ncbi:MAG: hypothetical protein JWM73_2640 [Solirubrobacterales bacterium]|nr:hypothetical protein [Solirubrobacterales bacterium]
MHISAPRAALAAALAGLALAAPAVAAPDRSVAIDPAAPAVSWDGAAGTGLNTSFFLDGTAPGQTGTCAKDPNTMCETTLVHVTGDDIGAGSVKFRIDGFQPISDFDLRVYTSDETGAPGDDISDPHGDVADSSPLGTSDPRHTSAGDYETTTIDLGEYLDGAGGPLDAYFLVEVPYFIVAQDTYAGHATLTSTPFVAETP